MGRIYELEEILNLPDVKIIDSNLIRKDKEKNILQHLYDCSCFHDIDDIFLLATLDALEESKTLFEGEDIYFVSGVFRECKFFFDCINEKIKFFSEEKARSLLLSRFTFREHMHLSKARNKQNWRALENEGLLIEIRESAYEILSFIKERDIEHQLNRYERYSLKNIHKEIIEITKREGLKKDFSKRYMDIKSKRKVPLPTDEEIIASSLVYSNKISGLVNVLSGDSDLVRIARYINENKGEIKGVTGNERVDVYFKISSPALLFKKYAEIVPIESSVQVGLWKSQYLINPLL